MSSSAKTTYIHNSSNQKPCLWHKNFWSSVCCVYANSYRTVICHKLIIVVGGTQFFVVVKASLHDIKVKVDEEFSLLEAGLLNDLYNKFFVCFDVSC